MLNFIKKAVISIIVFSGLSFDIKAQYFGFNYGFNGFSRPFSLYGGFSGYNNNFFYRPYNYFYSPNGMYYYNFNYLPFNNLNYFYNSSPASFYYNYYYPAPFFNYPVNYSWVNYGNFQSRFYNFNNQSFFQYRFFP